VLGNATEQTKPNQTTSIHTMMSSHSTATTFPPRGTNPAFVATMVATYNDLKSIERQTVLANPVSGWSKSWKALQTIAADVKRDHAVAGLQIPLSAEVVYQNASLNMCRSKWALPMWAHRLGISKEKSKYLNQVEKLRVSIEFYVPISLAN
jgi:hypothetical protein